MASLLGHIKKETKNVNIRKIKRASKNFLLIRFFTVLL